MIRRRLATLLTGLVLAVALSGCISVLPKSKPDQLYSFGAAPAAAPAPSRAPGTSAGVLLGAIGFPRAATGDGILTLTGTQTAYIAQSRWVGPASVLFREAVERAFDNKAQRSRLISRGETGRAALVLRIDVRDFAAVYVNGAETIPTVAVSLKARLTRPDGVAVDERTFEIRRQAADNRIGPIVEAFDKATDEGLAAVVAWTDETAAAQPAAPAGPTPARR